MRVISGEARGHTLKAPKGMTTRPMSDKIKGALYSMLSGLLDSSGREWGHVLDMYAGSGSIGIEALSRGATWADFVEVNAGVCRVISDNLEHTKFGERARVNNRNVAAFLNHPPGSPSATTNKRAAGGLHRRKGGKHLTLVDITEVVLPTQDSVAANANLETENGQSATQELWQYDIIFLDPPYADPKIPQTIEHVAHCGLVRPGGLVVIGHSPRVELAQTYGSIEADKTGEVVLNLLRHRRHGDSAFSIYIGGDPTAYGFGTDIGAVEDKNADEADAEFAAGNGDEIGEDAEGE